MALSSMVSAMLDESISGTCIVPPFLFLGFHVTPKILFYCEGLAITVAQPGLGLRYRCKLNSNLCSISREKVQNKKL
jgi:hypothetical protein